MLDDFDRHILRALEQDASLSNVQLSERVHLSASQCSRRRAALERAGVIRGYHADIDYAQLGRGISAVMRITLDAHGPDATNEFVGAIKRLDEVFWAAVVTGDADYVLGVRVETLEVLAEFIHTKLLTLKSVRQVRSDLVLRSLKPLTGD